MTSTNSRATSKKSSRTANNPPSDRRAGRIAGVFGVKGELKIKATTAGRSVLKAGQLLRCTNGEESRELIVAAVREHGGRSLVRFDAINDATAAEALVGGELYATRDAFVLDSGEYLDEDLVGCRLFQEDGRDLGVVDAVEHYPQQDMLVVGKNRVPLVSAFIQDIDLSARQIRVTLPPGLLD